MYVSSSWEQKFPNGITAHEPILRSDHATIIYDTNSQIHGNHRPYQLEYWCLTLPEIRGLIEKLWPTNFHGSPSFITTKKQHLVMINIKP